MNDDLDKNVRREEGASASSLIAVHKLREGDKAYDMQLMRDLSLANESACRFGRSQGGVISAPRVVSKKASETSDEIVEGDEMKLGKVAMLAIVAISSAGTTVDVDAGAAREGPQAIASGGHENATPGDENSKRGSSLGPEYKKIDSFVEFRKKLLSDGWTPVVNPECRSAVLGDDHEAFCRAKPASISCRACSLVPEIIKSTSDGYMLTRYTKNGVPLSVTSYGDITDLDEPGSYGLSVIGWEFSESMNVILLDD